MPPKKKAAPKKGGGGGKGGKNKKEVAKQKDKIIEDKTFGLKNKNKSAKVGRYVQQVHNQVNQVNERQRLAQENSKKQMKADMARQKLEMAQMMRSSVVQPKVPIGVDPKSILCEFHKRGLCTKGDRCKFSHNANVVRKSEKIDIYTDRRADETMEDWDEKELNEAIDKKQGQTNRNLSTNIVCKHFLGAIEAKKYGWFWECPNGGDKCIYLHRLPPGFVLKKAVKEDTGPKTELVTLLEDQREKLTGAGTPVTLERFLAWKEKKKAEKKEEKADTDAKRKAEIKAGKAILSGREMFTYNPELFVDDDSALDATSLIQVDEEEEVEMVEDQGDAEMDGTPDAKTNPPEDPQQEVGLEGLGMEIEESLFEDLDDLDDLELDDEAEDE